MSLRTSANRYAKALFDVALEEKADLAQIDRDLQAVAEMMKGSPDLLLNLKRGSVTDAQRQSLMEAGSKSMRCADGTSPPVVMPNQMWPCPSWPVDPQIAWPSENCPIGSGVTVGPTDSIIRDGRLPVISSVCADNALLNTSAPSTAADRSFICAP